MMLEGAVASLVRRGSIQLMSISGKFCEGANKTGCAPGWKFESDRALLREKLQGGGVQCGIGLGRAGNLCLCNLGAEIRSLVLRCCVAQAGQGWLGEVRSYRHSTAL